MNILTNLTQTELKHLFFGLAFTELEYKFKGRDSLGQEKIL